MIAIITASVLATMPSLVWKAEGRAEAERDIAAGTMKWKIYGYMAGLSSEDEVAREKMRKRFGIELVAVAQCVVTKELVERAEGYNERIREDIEGKHGVNALDQVWQEADHESRVENVALGWVSKFFLVVAGLWACRRVLRLLRGPHAS